jgi:hypothetical protein
MSTFGFLDLSASITGLPCSNSPSEAQWNQMISESVKSEFRHFFNVEIEILLPLFPIRIFLLKSPTSGRSIPMNCQTIE